MASLSRRYAGAALVTGASSGLGEAFARRLAREGFDLVVVARRADRLEALQQELERACHVRVHVLPCDLADDAAVRDLPRRITERGVAIGVVVHSAGFSVFGRFQDLDVDDFVRLIDINCRATVLLTGALLPGMLARKSGALVFVSSISAYQPAPFFATYGATKAFVLMYGEALWAELRRSGVDVIVVSPGYTHTELFDGGSFAARPIAGWSEPDEVVEACLGKLGTRPSVVPGFRNRVLVFMSRLSPRALVALGSYHISRRRHVRTRRSGASP